MIGIEGNQPVLAVDLQNRSVVLNREGNERRQRAGGVGDPDAPALGAAGTVSTLADAARAAWAQSLRLQRNLAAEAGEEFAPVDLHPLAVLHGLVGQTLMSQTNSFFHGDGCDEMRYCFGGDPRGPNGSDANHQLF